MNPVVVARAVRQALEYLDGAGWSLNELDQLYALRAKRGAYSSTDSDLSE